MADGLVIFLIMPYGKLKRIISNMKETITDIDLVIKAINSSDSPVKLLENSLRMSFVQYREVLFEGISSIIKMSNKSVNSFSNNKDIIVDCKAMGFFTEIEFDFFKTLNEYRNAASHMYKQPSYKQMIEFITKNRSNMLKVIENFEVLYNNSDFIKKIDDKLIDNGEIYFNIFLEIENVYKTIPPSLLDKLGSNKYEQVYNFI